MTTVTFDTPAYVKKLKAAGFTEQQAEALSTAHKEAIDTALVTKDDLGVEFEPVKIQITPFEGELKLVKWMLGLILAGIASLVVKAFFS